MSKPTVAQASPCIVGLEEGKEYWWCTCGLSKSQPFCDGSHQGTDFQPMTFVADKSGKRGLCACKQTQNPPYCDGAHKDIDD